MELEVLKTFLKLHMRHYLERSGNLEVITKNIYHYTYNYLNAKDLFQETFYCPIYINIVLLAEISGILCHILIKEPRLIQELTTELICTILAVAVDNTIKPQLSQIETPIVLTAFPFLGGYPSSGLCNLYGILIEYKTLEKYVRTTSWKCVETCCTTKPRNIYKSIPSSPPFCPNCAAPLQEILNARNYGKMYQAKICCIRYTGSSTVNHSVCIEIKDSRHEDVSLELGVEYLVTGVRRNNCMEAWGLHRIDQVITSKNLFSKIDKVRRSLSKSPWAFTHWLANLIGKDTYPSGVFKHFRCGLLLSLASLRSIKPISILAVCSDTQVSQQLMKEALKLSSRVVRPNIYTPLGGYVKENWLCAGSLLLAKNGVCYLSDWTTYTNKEVRVVREAVEYNKVTLECGDGASAPSRCAVWTYCNVPSRKKQKDQLFTLYKTFGLLWKTNTNEVENEAIADFVLNKRQYKETEYKEDDLKSYLEYINNINVTLSDEALEMIKKYFAYSRRARGEALPLTSLDPLIALSEAHARLNQRSVALPVDVLVALELCEKSLGQCPLLRPPPNDLSNFGQWLEENLFNFATNTLTKIL